jgi:hypothetical protein
MCVGMVNNFGDLGMHNSMTCKVLMPKIMKASPPQSQAIYRNQASMATNKGNALAFELGSLNFELN